MEMMRNPNAMREAMRNQDLAMSQLENLPGGFNAMRRMFEEVQEPMMEATQNMGMNMNNPSGASNTNNTANNSNTPASTVPTSSAVPNPWGGGGGAAANNQAGGMGANPFMNMGGMGGGGGNPFAGMGGAGGMGGQDPASVARMMQDPMMQQMMSNMMNDPQMVQQVRNRITYLFPMLLFVYSFLFIC
jgi:ubiquilin